MANKPSSPSLLGIPAELRNRIYKLVFTPTGPITDRDVFSTQGSKNLQLLRTCKQIYREARVLAFNLTVFITGQYEYDSLIKHLEVVDDVQWEAIQYITLATHWNPDLTDNYYGGSFGSDLSPSVTNFLWSALDIFISAKHIVLFNRGSTPIDFKSYLRVFVDRSYAKSLGTNPHGWHIIDDPENELCYTLKSVNTDRVVKVEYACAWKGAIKEGKEDEQAVRANPYQPPELRGWQRT